jgi:hypothetical protein
MALQDVAYGLVTDGVTQVRQCPHDAVIASRVLLLGHADNQGLQLRVGLRSSWGLALAIPQPEVSLELVAEDAILRHQVCVAQSQFLIDRPRDVCEQCLLLHPPCHLMLCRRRLFRPQSALRMRDGVFCMQGGDWVKTGV